MRLRCSGCRVISGGHKGAVSDVVEIGGGVISEWFNDS
jgi:hypothetical protein